MASWNVRLGGVDERLFLALLSRRRPWMDRIMRAVTVVAETPVIIAIALVLASGALPGLAPVGLEALVVLALSHGMVQIIKRAWPSVPVPVSRLGFIRSFRHRTDSPSHPDMPRRHWPSPFPSPGYSPRVSPRWSSVWLEP